MPSRIRITASRRNTVSGRRSLYRLLDLSYDEALTEALDEFAALFR